LGLICSLHVFCMTENGMLSLAGEKGPDRVQHGRRSNNSSLSDYGGKFHR